MAPELAPGGRLRAGINYGNVVLARREAGGELRGLHVDLALALGVDAGVPVDLAGFPAAGDIVERLRAGALDVGFLSYETARLGEVEFSPPYLEIDATYLVPPGSPLRDVPDVDRDGVRIAIAGRSVYEHYLKRALRHARLSSAPSTHAAYELFAAGGFDALVGLRPRLIADAAAMPASRVLEGRFMLTQQALAVPAGRAGAARQVRRFVEKSVASGLVARLLAAHGVRGAAVAPLQPGADSE